MTVNINEGGNQPIQQLKPGEGPPMMKPVSLPQSVSAGIGEAHMLGEKLIAAIVQSGKLSDLMDSNLSESLFNGYEVQMFNELITHAKKHGKVPAKETLLQRLDIEDLPEVFEPPSYYAEELRNRYIAEQIKQALLEAKELIMDQKNPVGAMNMLQAKSMNLAMNTSSRAVLDLRKSEDLLMSTYAQTMTAPENAAIQTGWETPDSFINGAGAGDMVSIVGRPADGKSWMMLYQALHAWKHQKKRVLVISMEMLPLVIAQRVSSMYGSTSFKHIMKAQLPTPNLEKYKKGLLEMADENAPFWVVDGNLTATVEDIWHYCLMLRPDAVYVDGAYLVGNSNKRLDRFARVAENARLFKSEIATNQKIPLFTTWQFSRQASKAQKAEKGKGKATIDEIGFSDEIGQLSSLIMAVQKNADVSSLRHKWIDILKGRNGETGGFEIWWDFYSMNFAEYVPDMTNLTMDAI